MTDLHVDLVRYQWLAGYAELMERIPLDDGRAQWHGSYVAASEPHSDADCPFRDTTRIYMQSVGATGCDGCRTVRRLTNGLCDDCIRQWGPSRRPS